MGLPSGSLHPRFADKITSEAHVGSGSDKGCKCLSSPPPTHPPLLALGTETRVLHLRDTNLLPLSYTRYVFQKSFLYIFPYPYNIGLKFKDSKRAFLFIIISVLTSPFNLTQATLLYPLCFHSFPIFFHGCHRA